MQRKQAPACLPYLTTQLVMEFALEALALPTLIIVDTAVWCNLFIVPWNKRLVSIPPYCHHLSSSLQFMETLLDPENDEIIFLYHFVAQ